MQNVQTPVAKKCLQAVRELNFLRSRVKLGLSFDSLGCFQPTLSTMFTVVVDNVLALVLVIPKFPGNPYFLSLHPSKYVWHKTAVLYT